MKSKLVTTFIVSILILPLCLLNVAFAEPANTNYCINSGRGTFNPQCNKIRIDDNHLTMTSSNTGIFHYTIFGDNQEDITSTIPASSIYVDAKVCEGDAWSGRCKSPEVSIDPLTKTCKVTCNFTHADKSLWITLSYSNGYSNNELLDIGIPNPADDKVVDKISFLTNKLTADGENIAIFNYEIYNQNDINITKDIPASQIEAFSAVYSTTFSSTTITTPSAITVDATTHSATVVDAITPSATAVNGTTSSATVVDATTPSATAVNGTTPSATVVDATTPSATAVDVTTPSAITVTTSSSTTLFLPVNLDPIKGTGTVKFNDKCFNKIIAITLIDKLTGKNVTLNTVGLGKNKVQKLSATEVQRIDFTSGNLIKSSPDKAEFQYNVLNRNFKNITDTIPISDIDAYAVIGTSKVKITLDPVKGKGILNYKFLDTDKDALVTITYKTGVTICEKLNIVNSESESLDDKNNEDLGIAKIVFRRNPEELYFDIFNKYGKNITKDIQLSQLAASSSVNSKINIKLEYGKLKSFVIHDNDSNGDNNIYYDPNRTIIVTITDKLSGVKASLNKGAFPEDTSKDKPKEEKADSAVVVFKDAILEKNVRSIINKLEGDIHVSDVKSITDLSVDDGCKDLSGIENLTGLKSLQLCSDKISSLEPLRKLWNLQILQYYTDSIADLKPLEELKNLSSLEVSCTQITMNDIQALGKLTNLRFLDVHDTKISKEGVGSLKLALKNCHISY